MKAFLLAAGLGKRLLPLTVEKPKCLIEVGGKSLLLWNIEKLKASGIKDLVINLFHEGHQIESFFGDGSDFGVRIEYVSEKELLGTGGGVGNALTSIGNEPFVLLSSDVWTDFNFFFNDHWSYSRINTRIFWGKYRFIFSALYGSLGCYTDTICPYYFGKCRTT